MDKHKIRCDNCQKLNSIKREYCYMCGKKLITSKTEIDKNINKKRLILVMFLLLLIAIIIGSIYYAFTHTLNDDEKYVVNKIEYFKKNHLKYPKSAVIEEILYYKNDNINEKNIILKVKAKNTNDEYITDYIYISTLNEKLKYIESNYCYEKLHDVLTSYSFRVNDDSTPYKDLAFLENNDKFLGSQYMGTQAKKDILDFKEGNEMDDNFVKIRKNNIINNIK